MNNAAPDPYGLIDALYGGLPARGALVRHGELVAEKALAVAARLPEQRPDLAFIHEAALLHDIGILWTHLPELGCSGPHPYVCHGHLGGRFLERKGFRRHARVCERHVGVGLSADEIVARRLPLPARDMNPVTLEEQIICFADKFFSKTGPRAAVEKSVQEIIAGLSPYGPERAERFRHWTLRFGEPASRAGRAL